MLNIFSNNILYKMPRKDFDYYKYQKYYQKYNDLVGGSDKLSFSSFKDMDKHMQREEEDLKKLQEQLEKLKSDELEIQKRREEIRKNQGQRPGLRKDVATGMFAKSMMHRRGMKDDAANIKQKVEILKDYEHSKMNGSEMCLYTTDIDNKLIPVTLTQLNETIRPELFGGGTPTKFNNSYDKLYENNKEEFQTKLLNPFYKSGKIKLILNDFKTILNTILENKEKYYNNTNLVVENWKPNVSELNSLIEKQYNIMDMGVPLNIIQSIFSIVEVKVSEYDFWGRNKDSKQARDLSKYVIPYIEDKKLDIEAKQTKDAEEAKKIKDARIDSNMSRRRFKISEDILKREFPKNRYIIEDLCNNKNGDQGNISKIIQGLILHPCWRVDVNAVFSHDNTMFFNLSMYRNKDLDGFMTDILLKIPNNNDNVTLTVLHNTMNGKDGKGYSCEVGTIANDNNIQGEIVYPDNYRRYMMKEFQTKLANYDEILNLRLKKDDARNNNDDNQELINELKSSITNVIDSEDNFHKENMKKYVQIQNKRQLVFMGIGPNREKELLVTKRTKLSDNYNNHSIYVQISPEKWDNVCNHEDNKVYCIPTYHEIKNNLADTTLYYKDVPFGSSSFIPAFQPPKEGIFGKKLPDNNFNVDIAFMNGIRLERPYDSSTLNSTDIGDILSNNGNKLNKGMYLDRLRYRLEPVIKKFKENSNGDGKVFVVPFGLGVYIDGIKNEHKGDIIKEWFTSLLMVCDRIEFSYNNIHTCRVPGFKDWSASETSPSTWGDSYVSQVSYRGYRGNMRFDTENLFKYGTVEKLKNAFMNKKILVIVPGDPVALPGNEAALGWLTASGDPFSLSFAAYRPIINDNITPESKCLGPYHMECKYQAEHGTKSDEVKIPVGSDQQQHDEPPMNKGDEEDAEDEYTWRPFHGESDISESHNVRPPAELESNEPPELRSDGMILGGGNHRSKSRHRKHRKSY